MAARESRPGAGPGAEERSPVRARSLRAAAPPVRRPRVFFAAHQRLIGEALVWLLRASNELEIDTAATIEELSGADMPADTDVVLLEVEDFGTESREALARLGPAGLRPPVVLLVDRVDSATVQAAIGAGVQGVIDRDSSAAAFVMAIKQVLAGNSIFPSRAVELSANGGLASGPGELSRRQSEVLYHLAQGRSNEEIGRDLFISVNTVKYHVREIYRKLGLRNRVEATRRYRDMRPPAKG